MDLSDDDLLGGHSEPAVDPIDDLLGGPAAAETDDIDAIGTPGNEVRALDWKSNLGLTEKGAIKGSLHDIALILGNDERTRGLPRFNEFAQRAVYRRPPGHKPDRRKSAPKSAQQLEPKIWKVPDPTNGAPWEDQHTNDVRRVFEAPKSQGGYEIKIADKNLDAAIDLIARKDGFHPVREYLESVTWDGEPRCETLFIDFLGVPDDVYHRSVARMMMTAAVTRVYEPGCKYDSVPILEGAQGIGKSTFIRFLAKNFFGELSGNFANHQQMIELMESKWVLELPELVGFQKNEFSDIKAFVSRQEDRTRLSYGKRVSNFPRQCILIGSTNHFQYINDSSGGRRWLPIRCNVEKIDTDRLLLNVDQLWAEALTIYRAMRADQPHGALPLYLTEAEAREIAADLQASRTPEPIERIYAGLIQVWLERPRHSGGFDTECEGELRLHVCNVELWCEALGKDRKDYTKQSNSVVLKQAMDLIPGWQHAGEKTRRFAQYGYQKYYRRTEHMASVTPLHSVERDATSPDHVKPREHRLMESGSGERR